MKKHSDISRNNARSGVRSSSYTPTPVVRKSTSQPSGSRKSTSSSSRSGSSRSSASARGRKKSGGRAAAIAISLVLVVIIAGAALFFTGLWKRIPFLADKFQQKYSITNPDGTVLELTEDELRSLLQSDVFFQGTIIDGIDVSGMTREGAMSVLVQNQPERPIDTNISLKIEDEIFSLGLSQLEFESNLNEIVDSAFAYLRTTGTETPEELIAIYNSREALKASPVSYMSAYTLTTDGVANIVHATLDSLVNEAVEAEITGFDVNSLQFTYIPSTRGYEIDIDKAIEDVKAMLDSQTYEGIVEVDAQVTEPEFTTEEILENFGRIAGSTSRTTASSSRNHNISITCEKIDGIFLLPGESFSFNTVVGIRNAATGYQQAGTIQNGTLKDDFGGGICQVSTMIYQSVVKSDLQVDEQNEHMWPSSYAEAGTDAAVDWPDQDFAFTNNTDYPVAMHAYWDPETSEVTVEIYGRLLPNGQYIEFIGIRQSTNPATTEYIADPTKPIGTTESVRGAHDGVTATSIQVWYNSDGTEDHRVEIDIARYATVNAQISVGVLNPDGSLATVDPATGAISGGVETTPSDETTAPSESTSESSASSVTESTAASSTESTEVTTAAPVETTQPPEPDSPSSEG